MQNSASVLATHRTGVTISVEGNIGVGKSTILRLIQNAAKDVEILPEPLDEWQNVNGTGLNMLDAFYQNPKRNAYLFQNFVFLTRFMQHVEGAKRWPMSIRLSERSVFTDRCVFAAAAMEDGLFSPLETAAYNAWYDPVLSALPNLVPDAFIYLQADPEVCFARLQKRARSEEVGVSLQYLTTLHEKHEKWFVNGGSLTGATSNAVTATGNLKGNLTHPCLDGIPYLIVDCNPHLEHIEDVPHKQEHIVKEVVDFAQRLRGRGTHTMK